jgi:O-antigen/teichoic acid export membrane protein
MVAEKNGIQKSSFSGDVLTLLTGTTISQIITVLASPVITRLYGPEAFGLLALFTSLTSVFIVISCLRYELAIMLPDNDEDAASVLGLCIILVLLVSASSVVLLFLFRYPLLQFLNVEQLAPYCWLIPVTILISGIFLVLNSWNIRTNQFSRLSVARVTGSCSSTGSQLGMGLLGYASGGVLIGASILGQLVSALTLILQITRDQLAFFGKNISWKGLSAVSVRYRDFPKYDTWSALLNMVSWQVPVFLLSAFFSTTIVGYYSLGMMIIQLPMSFIGSAIAQVFYQRVARARHENGVDCIVEDVFRILLVIGSFPLIVLTIIGQDFFAVVFGQIWAEAGIYVQILGLWALVWFIASPLSMLYVALEKQEFGFKFNVINFLTRLGSLIIGGLIGDPVIALLLFSVSGIIVYGYLSAKIFEYTAVRPTRLVHIILPVFIPILPAGLILLVMKLAHVAPLILVIAGTALCIAYYWYLIRRDPQITTILGTFIPLRKKPDE